MLTENYPPRSSHFFSAVLSGVTSVITGESMPGYGAINLIEARSAYSLSRLPPAVMGSCLPWPVAVAGLPPGEGLLQGQATPMPSQAPAYGSPLILAVTGRAQTWGASKTNTASPTQDF